MKKRSSQTQYINMIKMEIRSLNMKISGIPEQSMHMMRMGKLKKKSPMKTLSPRGMPEFRLPDRQHREKKQTTKSVRH